LAGARLDALLNDVKFNSGGCDNDLLVQLPFKWIMDKAHLHGLVLRKQITIDGDPRTASYADSYRDFLRGTYRWVARRHYRPIGVNLEETDNEIVYSINETIDSSVFERWRYDPQYRPPNLSEWARRYDVAGRPGIGDRQVGREGSGKGT
jgi:hypothetical protein